MKHGKKVGDTSDLNSIINAGKEWINEGKANLPDNMGEEDFAAKFSGIGQVLVAVGIVTLLIVGGIMAIKWITGTPDKQAKLKEQLIGLLVAAVVIFGAVGIWNFIRGIANDVETTLTSNINESVVIARK